MITRIGVGGPIATKPQPTHLHSHCIFPSTPSRLRHSIAATHLPSPTLPHLNHTSPTQNLPPPPCISKNWAHPAQFSGFCPQYPFLPTPLNCSHPPTQPHLIPPKQHPHYAKQPPPPCINKNQAHMTQFSGFCPQNPLPPTSFNCGHPPTQPHLITPQPYPPYAKTTPTAMH